nr:NADH-quinone oxidoreductase subunit NuoE [Hyphomicrobium sp.]
AAPSAPASPAPTSAAPAVHPAALTAMANAGLVKELQERGGGKPLAVDELEKMKAATVLRAPQFGGGGGGDAKPELLAGPRDGKGDDLGLIWGVADKLAEKLNALGIWHFDQIANWSPANVAWFEAQMDGFKGRIDRDKWIEQCQKLASGWRPGSDVGERPKG